MRKLAILATVVLVALLAGSATQASTAGDRVSKMSWVTLAKEAKKVVRNGGCHSVRHRDASQYLMRLSYELVLRAFLPFGTERWALYIVDRESGFNPCAVNTTYSYWREQARCLMQAIPKYHAWVDYKRCNSDPAYAVRVFVRMSRGGHHVSPWYL